MLLRAAFLDGVGEISGKDLSEGQREHDLLIAEENVVVTITATGLPGKPKKCAPPILP